MLCFQPQPDVTFSPHPLDREFVSMSLPLICNHMLNFVYCFCALKTWQILSYHRPKFSNLKPQRKKKKTFVLINTRVHECACWNTHVGAHVHRHTHTLFLLGIDTRRRKTFLDFIIGSFRYLASGKNWLQKHISQHVWSQRTVWKWNAVNEQVF